MRLEDVAVVLREEAEEVVARERLVDAVLRCRLALEGIDGRILDSSSRCILAHGIDAGKALLARREDKRRAQDVAIAGAQVEEVAASCNCPFRGPFDARK